MKNICFSLMNSTLWCKKVTFYIPVSNPQDSSKCLTLYSLADLFNRTPSWLLWEPSVWPSPHTHILYHFYCINASIIVIKWKLSDVIINEIINENKLQLLWYKYKWACWFLLFLTHTTSPTIGLQTYYHQPHRKCNKNLIAMKCKQQTCLRTVYELCKHADFSRCLQHAITLYDVRMV